MDSVVGDSVVEKRRLNPDGNSARETGARRKRHGGISLSGNRSDFLIFGFAYIPFVTHRDEYRAMRESAVLTFIEGASHKCIKKVHHLLAMSETC